MKLASLTVAMLVLLPGAGARADEQDFARALADYRADYDRRIGALEAEVAELRAQRTPEVGATSPSGPPGPPRLNLRGFGHIEYDTSRTAPRTPGSTTDTNHFTVGPVVLFISSQISEDISFYSENEFDFTADGVGHLDVERVMLSYSYAPWLNIGAGRGHTALGYWNQRFHHGTWLQTTTERPLIYAFESRGGMLPIHFVGLELTGNLDTPAGLVSYHANLANGRGDSPNLVEMTRDKDDTKMVSLMATLEPAEDLGIGFSVLSDRIPGNAAIDPTRAGRIEELIFGTHTYYQSYPYDLVAEILAIRHDDHSLNREFSHYGGYVQLGYAFGSWKPYYRFDFVQVEGGDPFYTDFATGGPRAGVEDTTQHTIGLRWDVRTYLALKAELRRLVRTSERDSAATLQASFAF